MKSIPVVISYHDGTKVVRGYAVKIGSLEGVFAATPSQTRKYEYVITHLATGQAIPGVSERTVYGAVKTAETEISKLDKKKYQAAVSECIKEWGPRIAAAYASQKQSGEQV